ncbi:hypothetical protein L209DRAFT_409711 [Thermothelomyces heterothallicus CBS 203.75]
MLCRECLDKPQLFAGLGKVVVMELPDGPAIQRRLAPVGGCRNYSVPGTRLAGQVADYPTLPISSVKATWGAPSQPSDWQPLRRLLSGLQRAQLGKLAAGRVEPHPCPTSNLLDRAGKERRICGARRHLPVALWQGVEITNVQHKYLSKPKWRPLLGGCQLEFNFASPTCNYRLYQLDALKVRAGRGTFLSH